MVHLEPEQLPPERAREQQVTLGEEVLQRARARGGRLPGDPPRCREAGRRGGQDACRFVGQAAAGLAARDAGIAVRQPQRCASHRGGEGARRVEAEEPYGGILTAEVHVGADVDLVEIRQPGQRRETAKPGASHRERSDADERAPLERRAERGTA